MVGVECQCRGLPTHAPSRTEPECSGVLNPVFCGVVVVAGPSVSAPVLTMLPPSLLQRPQKRCPLEVYYLDRAVRQLSIARLSATSVHSAVTELDDDILRPDAPEPRVAELVRGHLEAAVQRSAAAASAAATPPAERVDAAVEVVQIAHALALALQWQGLLWDALAVLDEEPVLDASAVLLSMAPPLGPVSACPRCECDVQYAEDDFDAPACECFPPFTREMRWQQELKRMREEMQRRIGALEEQARSFAATFSCS